MLKTQYVTHPLITLCNLRFLCFLFPLIPFQIKNNIIHGSLLLRSYGTCDTSGLLRAAHSHNLGIISIHRECFSVNLHSKNRILSAGCPSVSKKKKRSGRSYKRFEKSLGNSGMAGKGKSSYTEYVSRRAVNGA